MTIDWSARLREQGRFVRKIASDLPAALAEPGLTSREAAQLAISVRNCAGSFASMLAEMEAARLAQSYFRSAEIISLLWADLREVADARARDFDAPQAKRRSAG